MEIADKKHIFAIANGDGHLIDIKFKKSRQIVLNQSYNKIKMRFVYG